jgi:hypothetical protein
MTSNLDYKKYSLEKLQEWVHDALSSGEASPHEIYSAIREAVREDYYYHKDCISRASGLLELLSGHRPVKSDDSKKWDAWEEMYYPEEHQQCMEEELNAMCDKAASEKDKVTKWILPVQQIIEEGVDNYFIQLPDDLLEQVNWKNGDQLYWIDRGDGSFEIKKVIKPVGMEEC